jgi:hypothetical protein
LVESFGDNLKLKITLGFPIVNASSGNERSNRMCIARFCIELHENNEMEAHSLFDDNIIEYDVRLQMF